MQNVRIAPSILSADFANLGNEIKAVSEAGAHYIHIDVMDGHFVPNLTIGPMIVKAVRKYSSLPFDTHLMISNPDQYINAFAEAGSDIITVHAEACTHLHRTLQNIKATGKKCGVSIVPSMSPSALEYVMDMVDLILVMTVNPGFGGQSFISSQLSKIRTVRSMIEATGRTIDLQVDGGINPETAKQVISAGADVLVAGAAVFKGNPAQYQNNIESLYRF
ncbi:MAG TPA: ribulose-phosphate 3-epimerase [Rickettsiales bacterium]|nr:ribulose-phosphate 3-epimerase [Rickettsiales bacterium]